MKTILLLRHAKSDWGDPGLADFDRPLAKRGLKDAPLMGEALALFDCVPDTIVSSPAQRARQTAELVAKACGYPPKNIQWTDSFYGGGRADMIVALQRLPNQIESAMLIGHNPTLEETAVTLLAANAGGDGDGAINLRVPTAGLLCLEADITAWAELEPGDTILRWFLLPKLVKALR